MVGVFITETELMQARIQAFLADQVSMRALFDNLAFRHHDDPISVLHGRHSVCHDQRGASSHQALHGF